MMRVFMVSPNLGFCLLRLGYDHRLHHMCRRNQQRRQQQSPKTERIILRIATPIAGKTHGTVLDDDAAWAHLLGVSVGGDGTHPTVPRTGVHSRQLCRTVATGRTAGPAGGPCHLGLGTLPSSGRVTFTDKSDETTTGHGPVPEKPTAASRGAPPSKRTEGFEVVFLSLQDRSCPNVENPETPQSTQMTWPTLTIQTTVARGPAGHRADDTLPLRTLSEWP